MKQYKYVAVDKTEIVFRLLSAEESDRAFLTVSQRDALVDEYLFNLITGGKYDTDSLMAGIIPSVIFCAFKLSGVLKTRKDFPKFIDDYRQTIGDNAYYILYSTIIKTQPSYTLDGLKEKTLADLLELFAFSEMILGKQVLDTKKIYQMIDDDSTGKSKKKGIKSVTPEELEALKAAIGGDEGFEGLPPDEFSL